MEQVYVVGADDIAHVRTVQLGTQVGPNIVITSGLQPGDHVVTEGNDKVRDGAKVAPSPDQPPAAAPTQNPQGN
jgi:multidrug efflux pump subunit AcrA (membrane-fusion protein)